MKKRSFTKMISTTALALIMAAATITFPAQAATGTRHGTDSDGNVFLGGNYMEIGVSQHGSFGTSAAPAPDEDWNYTTYGKSSSGAYLGLFADGDGWDTGDAPVAGDFFTPGAPEERYVFSYKMNGETYNINVADRNGSYDSSAWKTEPATTDITSGNTLGAQVTGTTAQGVDLTITYTFDVNDLSFKTDVTYTNNSGYELSDVRFVRSFDPDQDKWFNGTYWTYNKVICNPDPDVQGSTSNCAMVVARGGSTLSGVFFLSIDNRTRASRAVAFNPSDAYLSGLWDEAPVTTLKAPTDEALACSSSDTNGYTYEDNAIALTTAFGTTAIGASDTTTYYTSLNPDVLSEFDKLKKALAASINYATEEIEALTPNASYEVTCEDTVYKINTDDSGSIPMTGTDADGNKYDFIGKNITIVEKNTDGTDASDPQTVEISSRPDNTVEPQNLTNTPEDIDNDDIATTNNSIKVKTVEGQEYRLGPDGEWISPSSDNTVTFTGLDELTEYTIYTRVKATDSAPASVVSDGVKVKTFGMFTDADVTENEDSGIYDGKDHAMTATVAIEGAKVTYSDSKNGEYSSDPIPYKEVGEYTVYYCISKDGYYNKYGTITSTITPKEVTEDDSDLTVEVEDQTYDGTDLDPIVIKDGDTVLTEGKDYTVEYTDNVNVGYAFAKITFTGNYSGEKEIDFAIKPAITVSEMTYTGKDQTPDITVKGLPEGVTISYYMDETEATENIPSVNAVGTYTIYYITSNDVTGSFEVTVKAPEAEKTQPKDNDTVDKTIDTKKNAIKLNASLKASVNTGKIVVRWGQSPDADKYVVYAAMCGKNYKKVATTTKNTVTLKKLSGKKIDASKCYKFYVVAVKSNKKIARSLSVHTAGVKSKKYTNIKKVSVKKSAITLKVGKTSKIKATFVLQNKKKKYIGTDHTATLRYISSKKKVASVSKNGTIKALSKGTATIYVYSISGSKTKIKVTVK